jgi:hypothetical protein
MNLTHFLWQTATLAVGGSMIVLVAYFLVKGTIVHYMKSKNLRETNRDDKMQLLQLRLQAHERMVIFVDRINPSNLLIRLHRQGIEVGALQNMILNEVKAEYQHNITQQLYIDSVTWDIILKLKEDTIAMINNAVKGLSAEGPGLELSRKVLQHMSTIEENPYELTIGLIKQNIHKIF